MTLFSEKDLLHKFVEDAALMGSDKAVAAAKAEIETQAREAESQIKRAVYRSPFFWLLCSGWLAISIYLFNIAMDPEPFSRLFAPGAGVLFNLSCLGVLLFLGQLGLYHCQRSGHTVDQLKLNWAITQYAKEFPLEKVGLLEQTMAEYPEFNVPLGPDGLLNAHSVLLEDFLKHKSALYRAETSVLQDVEDAAKQAQLASQMRRRNEEAR